MELYQLKSFLAVANTGSLSRAAVVRNISLPGISKHIKMLEEQMGFSLFTRTSRGMELTEKGQQVLAYAERIQRDVDYITALSGKTTPIRIGLNISPDFIELFQLKKLLEQHHPKNEILLTNQNSGTLLERLNNGELDLCLAFGLVSDRFQKLLIRNVQMPLMIPVHLQRNLSDLNKECWIINSSGCPFKNPLEDFWRTQGIHPESTILAQDLSRKELVAQGLGIGFLEPQDGLSLINTGQARQHGSHFLKISLWVVFLDPSFQPVAEQLQSYVQIRYASLRCPASPAMQPGDMENLAN